MRIVDLDPADASLMEALARLSHTAAGPSFPNWLPTLSDARKEVADGAAEGHITRVCLDDHGVACGWISAVHVYGKVWEIHPLLVDPRSQGRGIGKALVAEIEALVPARGAGVLIVGTADETGATTLGGVDLYDGARVVDALARFAVRKPHPVAFWLERGYALVGVTPDAEGVGLPTINLAKRVG